jgi:3,4-dihydroxy 2-butanone 4-phosphate synthase / GTP cyclohydrolase II
MPDPIHEAIRAFADGELVVVTDDEDREGDLIVAASLCTSEKRAFIIRHTSGIACTPITTDGARRLRLDPMVAYNESNHTTTFTVSIDYNPDGGSGISADERASCCRALSNPNVGADDFARPGHVFPLIARDGGVLLRSGHTEAAVDRSMQAERPTIGRRHQLMNEDGTVLKGAQVARFAAAHKLRYVTIADIIAYRQAREKLIERVATFTTGSQIGPLESHVYRSPFDSVAHVASSEMVL